MKTIEQKDPNTVVIDGVTYTKVVEVDPAAEPDNWPKKGDECWCLGGNDVHRIIWWNGNQFDEGTLARGEIFRTKEECERADAVLRATKRCKDWIAANLEEWEPDWENGVQEKCGIVFNEKKRGFCVVRHFSFRYTSYYFRTEKDAEAFISACEADLRVIWG